MAYNPVQKAGMRLSGVKMSLDPIRIAAAERELTVAYLERYIARAIAQNVDKAERTRLAKWLIGGVR